MAYGGVYGPTPYGGTPPPSGGVLGTLTPIDGEADRDRTASGTLTVSLPLDSQADRNRTAEGTLTVTLPLAAPTGPGWEFTQRNRTAHGVLSIRPSLVPDPVLEPIQTVYRTYSGVTVVDGQPELHHTGTVHGTWGFPQVVVAGRNVTVFRDCRTLVGNWADSDPGGDESAVLTFPAITPWDTYGTGALAWLYDNAVVEILRVDADGAMLGGRPVFQGNIGPLSESVARDSGSSLTVNCIGVWEALDQRITKPRVSSEPLDTGIMIARMVNNEIDFGFPAARMIPNPTGVYTGERGSFGEPLASGTLTDLLATVAHEGEEWTVGLHNHRQLYVYQRDLVTPDFDLYVGQQGVTHNLTLDGTSAFTNVYGMGQDGPHAWRNYMYPNAPVDPPEYPLPDGVFFNPGDSGTGFAELSAQLRTRGYHLASGDTYLAEDEDEVRRFQDVTGIQVDGVVGGQTWNQAFQTGANAHALDGAYPAPIAEVRATDPFTYDGRGARTGAYPFYDPHRARREKLVQFGMASKALARASATHDLARHSLPGYTGTVTLTNIDPEQMCALDIRAGMRFHFHGHHGTTRLMYVTRVSKDPGMTGDRVVTLTVDEQARPLAELFQIIQRNRGIADLAGRRKIARRGTSKVSEPIPFDWESGAGMLSPKAQTARLWNVYWVPLGETSDIVRIRLVANQATEMSAALFDRFIEPEQLIRLNGLAHPDTGTAGGNDPWQVNQEALLALGMVWASGSVNAMQGYWPNDPDGALTGVLDDSGPSVTFIAQTPPWGFLAVWTSETCRVSGDPAEGFRAIYPAAAQ